MKPCLQSTRPSVSISCCRIMSSDICRHPGLHRTQRRGFTLLEMLIAIAIIALLLSISLSGFSRVRASARSVRCLTNQRDAGLAFQYFADGTFSEDRGRSNRCPDNEFFFEDFVEKLYGVDEFWDEPIEEAFPIDPSRSTMMCPAAPDELNRVPDRPCNDGAVLPFENVSYVFNRRLYAETIVFEGRLVFNPRTKVTSRVLDHPNVPLVFDGDGERATAMRRRPYFSAPPLPDQQDMYSDGSWWFPSNRHRERTNVVFVGGHAASSATPADELFWDWKYQPTPLH